MRVVRFIVRNWPLKIGAVLLAVILYVAMVTLQSTQQWPGTIVIDTVNQPPDAVLIDAQSMPQVSDIRYVAPPDVPISQSIFRATIDLANVKVRESGSSLVRVKLEVDDPRVQIIDYRPQLIPVSLEPIIHKQVNVHVDTGALPSGIQTGTQGVSASSVDVSGAASIVRKVAYAGARIRIDASGLDVNTDVDLVARDASDAVVNNVSFNPRTVHVQMLIGSQIRSETVPVNPVIVDAPAAGYFITSIDVKPPVVSIQGQADALALLKGKANTKPISIAGGTGDVTVKVGLDLPNGVTSTVTQTVTVVIHLKSPDSTRSVSVGVVPTGARSDRVYTLSAPSVIVTLGGQTASLNAFDTSTLVGAVQVGALDVGARTVSISVAVPAGIKVVAVNPAQITVTVASVPSPAPSTSLVP